MGAFLRDAPRRRSMTFPVAENFSQVQRISCTSPSAVGAIELVGSGMLTFPLLRDPSAYHPDTVDMASDTRLQHYWLDLLDKNLSDLAAMETVRHPVKFDHLPQLLRRLRERVHCKAILFTDNSGADAILGVLPFARFLARRGTAVVLAANTRPAVNDVTAFELDAVLRELASADAALAAAVASGKIRVIATGSSEPCLGEPAVAVLGLYRSEKPCRLI
ncbi:hypothetical protein HK405_010354 [Cladochytrium tenue]|nr:hypothetical protein HK405_010354 [Cladochytrium tenue]